MDKQPIRIEYAPRPWYNLWYWHQYIWNHVFCISQFEAWSLDHGHPHSRVPKPTSTFYIREIKQWISPEEILRLQRNHNLNKESWKYFCTLLSPPHVDIDISFLQVFVETLDKCFENVCELDLIFHMDKVRLLFPRRRLQLLMIDGLTSGTNDRSIYIMCRPGCVCTTTIFD